MKISVLASENFIGKNLVENLKNIRDGKNRTRPNLFISDIYENEIKDADITIMLPGAKFEQTSNNEVIYVASLNEKLLKRDVQIDRLPEDALIYRLPEIIGKWEKPDEGVIAGLCHAVANDEEYEVENRNEIQEILFVDDFVTEILDALEGHPHRCEYLKEGSSSSDLTAQWDGMTPRETIDGRYCYCPITHKASLGTVVDYLESFKTLNDTHIIPEIPAGSFVYKLYSMYLSYLPESKMSYPLKMNVDERGVFTELIKTENNGQVSINITRPGNVRGQHWHNTKWEIFIVVSGHGLIQERKIGIDPETGAEYKVREFEVNGEEMRAVIMLPGYAHNIINLEKDKDLVTVMWANESFNPEHPDTFREEV